MALPDDPVLGLQRLSANVSFDCNEPFLGNRVVRYLSVNCTKLESIYQTILG